MGVGVGSLKEEASEDIKDDKEEALEVDEKNDTMNASLGTHLGVGKNNFTGFL